MSTFELQGFHNAYLAAGQQDIDAIITVATGGEAEGSIGPVSSTAPPTEVIIVDTSGSMDGEKLREARRATAAAIECIRDGVHFAVLEGDRQARAVYPPVGVAEATATSRVEAVEALRRLKAQGGTAIGRWIDAATALFRGETGVRHAILLTDGRDESEKPEELEAALARAAGSFQCDCRGVGADWEVAELRRIANALLGTVDIVADPRHLADDFQAMMREAMGKSVADVEVRVWTPQGADIQFFKQVAPEILDLTPAGQRINDLTVAYPTGAWGNESRDYHLAVRVKPGGLGDEMLAARVSAVVDGVVGGQALIQVTWTEDSILSTRINRQVAHYTGQQELADAIQEGLEARKNGDPDTAIVKLGRAVQLAAASDNKDLAALLERVVEVDDAATGRVRLKSSIPVEDEMTLDTRSTKTARVHR